MASSAAVFSTPSSPSARSADTGRPPRLSSRPRPASRPPASTRSSPTSRSACWRRVTSRASASRRRFAEALRAAWRTAYFSGKDECALAAYEAYSRQLATRLAVAWECADSLSGRVHAAADAALEFAARRPGAAHLLAEGVLAVGPDGLALQQGSLARLAAALHRERPLAAARASTLTEQVRIAGVAWLLSDPLRALDPDRLPEFSSQVTAVLLAPYGIPAEA